MGASLEGLALQSEASILSLCCVQEPAMSVKESAEQTF